MVIRQQNVSQQVAVSSRIYTLKNTRKSLNVLLILNLCKIYGLFIQVLSVIGANLSFDICLSVVSTYLNFASNVFSVTNN